MSISFTPTQSHVILLAVNSAERLEDDEFASEYTAELFALYTTKPPSHPKHDRLYSYIINGEEVHTYDIDIIPFGAKSVSWVWSRETLEFRNAIQIRRNTVRNAAVLIERAYWRFRKEFEAYTSGQGALSAVKQYHRLLIDTLAPFMSKK